jgi:hypothetical protein
VTAPLRPTIGGLASSGTLVVLALTGCHRPAAAQSPRGTSDPTARESHVYRTARAQDLKFYIHSWKPGDDGFPEAIFEIRSQVDEDLVVPYTYESITLHCGQYVASGPVNAGHRREIVDAYGSLLFYSLGKSVWTATGPDGRPELMVPTHLPKGTYSFWATFKLAGVAGENLVETEKQDFESE